MVIFKSVGVRFSHIIVKHNDVCYSCRVHMKPVRSRSGLNDTSMTLHINIHLLAILLAQISDANRFNVVSCSHPLRRLFRNKWHEMTDRINHLRVVTIYYPKRASIGPHYGSKTSQIDDDPLTKCLLSISVTNNGHCDVWQATSLRRHSSSSNKFKSAEYK